MNHAVGPGDSHLQISDYDVRFIYAHTSDWYLSFDVVRQRDVIEYPIIDEIDCGVGYS
ncbi:MAG: nucleotidyltransferase domain-containing protein [Methylococcales bacterium]